MDNENTALTYASDISLKKSVFLFSAWNNTVLLGHRHELLWLVATYDTSHKQARMQVNCMIGRWACNGRRCNPKPRQSSDLSECTRHYLLVAQWKSIGPIDRQLNDLTKQARGFSNCAIQCLNYPCGLIIYGCVYGKVGLLYNR